MFNKQTKTSSITDILQSFDKIETIIKVLKQTIFEDKDLFDTKDTENLYSVLLREMSYTKSKITQMENDTKEKITL